MYNLNFDNWFQLQLTADYPNNIMVRRSPEMDSNYHWAKVFTSVQK